MTDWKTYSIIWTATVALSVGAGVYIDRANRAVDAERIRDPFYERMGFTAVEYCKSREDGDYLEVWENPHKPDDVVKGRDIAYVVSCRERKPVGVSATLLDDRWSR